jgi:hypothetical protein
VKSTISTGNILLLEKGGRKRVRRATLDAIAGALGISVDAIEHGRRG